MAIKVTVGQTTFIKKIVIGTPVSTARESLSLDEFSDFDVGTKSDGQILVYDSAEGAFKNYTLATGNGVEKLLNTSTDRLQIQLDSESSTILSGLTLKGHLLPGQDSSFDLGDSAVKFRDLYLSGSTIHLGGLKLKDSSGGFSVKDSAGSSVNFDLAGSRAQIRSFFSGQGDLTYDSATGVFQFDVEDVYTKANFDSDFNLALDSAALEGAGLKYTNATNTLAIDSSELYSLFKHDDFDDFVADEHVAHSGVTITAGAGLTGGGTIASSRTIDVVGGKGIIANANDIQVDSANIRGMFIANKGLSYDSETGTFNIDSDNIRGMFIGNKGFTYDSELGTFDIDSANVRGMFTGGEGIHSAVSSTGIIKIDSAELYSLFKHNDFSDHVPDEHVPHGQISITAGKGLTGGGTIASTRIIDVDSANLVTMSRNALSGTNGISYTAGTGVIRAPQPLDSAAKPVFAGINADSGHITALSAETIQRTSVVTAATYGSATQIPVLVIDSSGFIDSATTVTVAGVTSTSFDSSTGIFTINTADGNSFTTHIQDSADHVRISRASLSATDAGGDGSFTYDKSTGVLTYTGPSASEVRAHLSGNKGLTYNSSTGVFDIDSANIDNVIDSALGEVSVIAGTGLTGGGTIVSDKTLNVVGGKGIIANANDIQIDSANVRGMFIANKGLLYDSELGTFNIDSANVRGMFSGGTGITYNSGTGEFTTTDGEIVHDNLSGFVADEHVAHGGVVITAGKGLTGGGTIASSRTIDVDSANLVTMSRNALSGTNGISYTAGTGVIRAPQPLDSNANPTFNQLRGPAEFVIDPAAIGNATGTVKILGDLQVDGVTTTINSTAITLNDKTIVLADSSADSSALNGAGIIWGGDSVLDNPSLLYSHSNARLEFNRPISASLGTLTDLTVDSARITTLSVPESGQVQINCDTTTIGGNGASILSNSALYIKDTSGNSLGFDANEITASSSLFLNAGASGADVHIQSLGESMLVANGNGGVQIYYNNAQKFVTTDSGVNITGDIRLGNVDFTNNGIIDSARLPLGTFAAGGGGSGVAGLDSALAIDLLTKNVIRFGTDVQLDSAGGILFDVSDKALEVNSSLYSIDLVDNAKIKFGSDNDGYIRHTGSILQVISDTGGLNLKTNADNQDVIIQTDNGSGGTTDYLRADGSTGAVKLSHYGDVKFETTEGGVTVTGTMNADSATLSGMLKARNGAISLNNEDSDVFSTLIVGERTNNDGFASLAFNPSSNTLSAKIDATSNYIAVWSGKNSTQGQRFNINFGTADETVKLRPNAVTRLEANKYGATVTGTMNADSSTLTNLTITGTSAGALNFTSTSTAAVLQLNNNAISEVHQLFFNDPGPDEGISWSGGNTKIYESPNNLTTNSAGNLQFVHTGNRRLTVSDSGAEVVGQLLVDSSTASGNIRSDGGNLIMGDEAYSTSASYVGMKTSAQSGTSDYMIISGLPGVDGNTYLSAKSGSSVRIRAGGNDGSHEIIVSSSHAKFVGDMVLDSAGAIMFDKSDQALEVNAATHSINLVDNAKINFGTGKDFEIYDDGTISRMQADRNLYLKGTAINFYKAGSSELMAAMNQDGAVELYYDAAKKLETTATGVTVTGLLSATTKSFDIEHPTKEGMRLRYGSLEGPENGVYVRGRATSSIIELPEYWTGLVDEDTITVELTPIGKHQKLYVEDIADNKIMIGNDNLINKKINCFYIVYGERKDVDKVTVEY